MAKQPAKHAIATHFKEIIGLNQLRIHTDIIVEKHRRRLLGFHNAALWYVCERWKEDEPRLISIRTLTEM